MPQRQNQPKVATMTLRTRASESGKPCVRRAPPKIEGARRDIDVVRISNANDPGSGRIISVAIDPAEAAKLFDPVPQASQQLAPNEFVDWIVKTAIDGVVGVKFGTDPDNCTGSDQDDIVISC